MDDDNVTVVRLSLGQTIQLNCSINQALCDVQNCGIQWCAIHNGHLESNIKQTRGSIIIKSVNETNCPGVHTGGLCEPSKHVPVCNNTIVNCLCLNTTGLTNCYTTSMSNEQRFHILFSHEYTSSSTIPTPSSTSASSTPPTVHTSTIPTPSPSSSLTTCSKNTFNTTITWGPLQTALTCHETAKCDIIRQCIDSNNSTVENCIVCECCSTGASAAMLHSTLLLVLSVSFAILLTGCILHV